MHGFHTKVKHACFVFVSAAVEFTDMRVYCNIVYCIVYTHIIVSNKAQST